MSDLLQLDLFSIEYKEFGNGDNAILFFHGFGRNIDDAEVFLPLLHPNQRIVSIHLFAHGRSSFPSHRIEKEPLTHQEWQTIVDRICAELEIDQFDLVAYSMGGRIAMMTALLCTTRVKSVLLLAPDGFKINPLYTFASGTALGRSLYRAIIHNPKPLFLLANFLHRIKILHPKLHRFVNVHLDDPAKRQQVYDAWLVYRLHFPDQPQLAELIRKKNFRFNMIFGKYDSIIKPRLGLKFSQLIGNDSHFYEVEEGHRLLTGKTVAFIRDHSLWPSPLS